MPNTHLVVGLVWYGPYALEEAHEAARDDFGGVSGISASETDWMT